MLMVHTQLLDELGSIIGTKLVLDEHNQCVLLLDDRLMISIRAVDGAFIYYGMLGEFPEKLPNETLVHLLSLNTELIADSTSIAIEPHSNAVLLLKTVSLSGLNASALSDSLAEFSSSLESLINQFNNDVSELPLPEMERDSIII